MNTIPVRMDKALFDSASIEGKAEFRSAAQQLNFWALVGKNALANPDLPVDFIRDILIAKNQETEPFKHIQATFPKTAKKRGSCDSTYYRKSIDR